MTAIADATGPARRIDPFRVPRLERRDAEAEPVAGVRARSGQEEEPRVIRRLTIS